MSDEEDNKAARDELFRQFDEGEISYAVYKYCVADYE